MKLIDCLEKLHETGFTHGDLKLENVLLREVDSNQLVLVDLGCS
jgi:serine/threonine protein kinase